MRYFWPILYISSTVRFTQRAICIKRVVTGYNDDDSLIKKWLAWVIFAAWLLRWWFRVNLLLRHRPTSRFQVFACYNPWLKSPATATSASRSYVFVMSLMTRAHQYDWQFDSVAPTVAPQITIRSKSWTTYDRWNKYLRLLSWNRTIFIHIDCINTLLYKYYL